MTSPGGRLQGAKSRDSVDSDPVNRKVSTRRKRRPVRQHCDSVDSQFTEPEDDDDEIDEEMRFFEACVECDDDALYDLLHDGLTYDDVNKQDKSGRTGLSHACGNGFMPILQLLDSVEEIDPNMPDNDGNTPLIFAAQAGHDDIVNFLLRRFHRLKVDQCNKLGFTALMKAAIQGRSRCAKLLLFAGASPNRRDYGRRLCAEEWARFCGRHSCADAIQKYIRSTKYFFAKTFLLAKDKWKSEPDLMQLQEPPAGSNAAAAATGSPTVTSGSGGGGSGGSNVTTSSSAATTAQHKSGRRDSGTWIQRHLSLSSDDGNSDNNNNNNSSDGNKKGNWFKRHLSLKRKKNQNQVTTDPGQDEADQQQQQSSAGTSPTKSSSTATWRQRSGSPLKRSGSVASSSRRRRSSQAGGEDEDGSQDGSDNSNDSDNDDWSCSQRCSLTDADDDVMESQAGGAGSRLTGRRSSCVPVCTSTLPLPMICVTLDSSTSSSSTSTALTSTTATEQQDSPVSEEQATGSGDDVETSDV